MMKLLTSSISALYLTACAVGPDYAPDLAPPQDAFSNAFTEEQAGEAERTETSADGAWWEALNDPMLTSLINDAVTHNNDLKAARANVRIARALRAAAFSKFLPGIDAGGSFERRRASENGVVNLGALQSLGVAQTETNLVQTGFDAGWEIDVFGGTRRAVEAARADLAAADEARRSVMVSVIAEVARNYAELRGAQERLELIDKNIGLQNETLNLVKAKYQTGLVSELDVSRAQTNLSATKARRPSVLANVYASAHRIAVLTGRAPADLIDGLLEASPMPIAPDLVPTGLPSSLLLRRSDVRAAERRLAASSANIGVAKAAIMPKFFLTGSGGYQSVSFTDLFKGASSAWSIGPTVRFPIFQGGRLRADLNRAHAEYDFADAQFQQSVLVAVADVETSLVRYAQSQLRQRDLADSVSANTQSVHLATILYEQGLSDFLDLLDVERSLVEIEDQYVQSRTQTLVHTIALYKALGGGWAVFENSEGKDRDEGLANATHGGSAARQFQN